ncbi:MAG: hypothetical protein Tsb002_14910 [Wenzhouxiangellaceae bacterium]
MTLNWAVAAGASEEGGYRWHLDQARQLTRATDFDQAWQHLQQARELLDSDPASEAAQRIEWLIISADYYANSGGGEQIFQALDQARELAREHGLHDSEAHVLKQSSQYLAGRGDFSAAWVALENARSLYQQIGDERRVLELQAFASLLASRQGDHQRAGELATRAVAELSAAGQRRMAMNALSIKAYSEHQLGRHQQALESYQRLIPEAWAMNDQLQLNSAYCNIAQVKRDLGVETAVETDLRQTVAALDRARQRLPRTPQERSAFVDQQVAAYSRLAEWLVDRYRDDEALAVLARFRAQAYYDNLSLVEVGQQQELPAAIREREQALLDALAAARLASAADAGAQTEAETELLALRADYWQRQTPFLVDAPALTAAELQAGLNADEAVINYWQLADRVLVWVLTSEQVAFTNIPLGAAEMEQAIKAYTAPFKWPWLARDQALSGEEASHIALGQKLYRWLVDSLPPNAAAKSRWIIIPHGPLYELPWPALIKQCDAAPADNTVVHAAYAHCTYLGQQYSVRYASSLSAAQHLRQRAEQRQEAMASSATARFLGVSPGDAPLQAAGLSELPAAAAEVQRLQQDYPQPTVLSGDEANESQFKSAAPAHQIIHLATHGLISEQQPLSSGVLLAADDHNDGLLQAYEVLSLKLDARLVTLAACSSATGRISSAEGLIGLGQSFLYAGADAVLAYQWDLPDRQVAAMLQPFYQARRQGNSDDQALQVALNHLLQQKGEIPWVTSTRPTALAHPRFWAGYRLMGAL